MGKILLKIFIASFLAFIVFYLWGSSSNLEESQYALINDYKLTPTKDEDSVFRIITYNIGYLSGMTNNQSVNPEKTLFDDHLNQVIETFNKIQPDILALQEIDFGGSRSYYVNQNNELAKKLNLGFTAEVINWDKKYVPFPYFPPTVQFGEMLSGQSVISKYPIHSQKRIVLQKPKSNPFYKNAFYIDRLAQVTEIEINDKVLMVINVHLEAYDWRTRTDQSKVVIELFRKYAKDYPTIILGDFNSNIKGYDTNPKPSSISLFVNEKGMKHASPMEELNTASTFTFPSDKPLEQIDFIFYNDDKIEKVAYKLVKEVGTASDHLPVMMDFKLK